MPNAPRRFNRAGLSVPAFAELTGLNELQVRTAIKLGQLTTFDFAGLRRIPYSEAERLAPLLGIKVPPPVTPYESVEAFIEPAATYDGFPF